MKDPMDESEIFVHLKVQEWASCRRKIDMHLGSHSSCISVQASCVGNSDVSYVLNESKILLGSTSRWGYPILLLDAQVAQQT